MDCFRHNLFQRIVSIHVTSQCF